jgi:hypothetical protein
MHRATTGKLNHLLALIVAAMLVLMVPLPAFAAGGASFNGQGATNVWEYDSVNVTAYGYDLFGAATKDLTPGDVRSISVSLRNSAPNPVDFRLAARSLSTTEARYLEAAYPGKSADESLLDLVDVVVRHGATTLYSGTLRGVSSSELYSSSGVAIGRVSAGWVGSVTVELSVRGDVGSAYMDKLCAVEWVFIAAQYDGEELPVVPPPYEPPAGPAPTPAPERFILATPVDGVSTDTTVVVIDDTPLDELPDAPTPTSPGATSEDGPDVIIEAEPVPQAPGQAASWAALNLVLTGVSGVLMVALMARFLLARDRTREVPGKGPRTAVPVRRWLADETAVPATAEERIDAHARTKGMFWLIGICAIIVSVVIFILTEDMSLPMQWADTYTTWHALIVLVEVLLLIFPRPIHAHSPQQG